MSHLSHEVCGVDFFLNYNKCDPGVIKLVEYLKIFFNKKQLKYFSNDSIEFNQNYLFQNQLQSIRSKIFLFFIDKYSLECEWFLNYFIYAREHCLLFHLPILIPIIFDQDLIADTENEEIRLFDKSSKEKLLNELTKDCLISFRISETSSYEDLVNQLREAIVDIIPINDENEESEVLPTTRFIDNKRPLTFEEEEFFEIMKIKEHELSKKLIINRINLKSILPKDRFYVALSISYNELNSHINTMINVQCHLIWIDSISINNIIYFNFLWAKNEDDFELGPVKIKLSSNNMNKEKKSFSAKPPKFIIFYDLNTAQMAQIYKEYSQEKYWNIELVESYVRTIEPSSRANKENTRKHKHANQRHVTFKTNQQKSQATNKSFDEIFYICQFKYNPQGSINTINKLNHSVIDTRFYDVFKETIRPFSSKKIYMPIRLCPVLVNVNIIANKHYYYTSLYKSIENYTPVDKDDFNEKTSDLTKTSLFEIKKDLNDTDLVEVFNKMSASDWKLIDLKSYKDEKSITRFSTLWCSIDTVYEGTYKLLVGLNKIELLSKINEMSLKGMHPRFLTSYGYINKSGEHLYAVFFCQI